MSDQLLRVVEHLEDRRNECLTRIICYDVSWLRVTCCDEETCRTQRSTDESIIDVICKVDEKGIPREFSNKEHIYHGSGNSRGSSFILRLLREKSSLEILSEKTFILFLIDQKNTGISVLSWDCFQRVCLRKYSFIVMINTLLGKSYRENGNKVRNLLSLLKTYRREGEKPFEDSEMMEHRVLSPRSPQQSMFSRWQYMYQRIKAVSPKTSWGQRWWWNMNDVLFPVKNVLKKTTCYFILLRLHIIVHLQWFFSLRLYSWIKGWLYPWDLLGMKVHRVASIVTTKSIFCVKSPQELFSRFLKGEGNHEKKNM